MNASVRSVLIMVVLLVLTSALVSRLPTPDAVRNLPFERRGVVGQDVSTVAGTYRVIEIDGVTKVVNEDRLVRTAMTTSGLILIVTIWHAGNEVASVVDTPMVRDAHGRLSGGSQLIEGLSNCTSGQPVLGQTCELVFEASPEWLVGAELLIPTEWAVEGNHDEVAVINLGITPGQVAEWLNRGDTWTMAPARPGPP